MKRRIAAVTLDLLAIGWMILIFVLSHQTGSQSESLSSRFVDFFLDIFIDKNSLSEDELASLTADLGFLIRKGAHMTEYLILFFLCYFGLHFTFRLRFNTLIAFGITLLYAISDEIHQFFVDNRNGSPIDVLIDISGVVIFLLIVKCIENIGRFKRGNQNDY